MKLVAQAASRIPIVNLLQPHNRDLWTVHLTINFISLKALVSEVFQTVILLLKVTFHTGKWTFVQLRIVVEILIRIRN